MTPEIIYTLGAVLLVSLISLIGIIALSFKESVLHKALFILVSVAAGALFGDAFLHLIPEAFEEASSPKVISFSILGGIFLFFSLEKFLRWRHGHDTGDECVDDLHPHEPTQIKPLGHLVIVSDALHNAIDGLIIAVSFLASIPVGIATTIAIILHEIPQEISDFGVLLHAGFSKKKAIFMNFVSALFAFVGAFIGLRLGESAELGIPVLSSIAAGAFIYIAGADLLPEIQKTTDTKRSVVQFLAILLGVALMASLLLLEGESH